MISNPDSLRNARRDARIQQMREFQSNLHRTFQNTPVMDTKAISDSLNAIERRRQASADSLSTVQGLVEKLITEAKGPYKPTENYIPKETLPFFNADSALASVRDIEPMDPGPSARLRQPITITPATQTGFSEAPSDSRQVPTAKITPAVSWALERNLARREPIVTDDILSVKDTYVVLNDDGKTVSLPGGIMTVASMSESNGDPGIINPKSYKTGSDKKFILDAAGNKIEDVESRSYGLFQLTVRHGNVANFIDTSSFSNEFEGLEPGSDAFNEKWQEVAGRDPEIFAKEQYEYVWDQYYTPIEQFIRADYPDFAPYFEDESIENSIAFRSYMVAASINHGVGGLKRIFRGAMREFEALPEEEQDFDHLLALIAERRGNSAEASTAEDAKRSVKSLKKTYKRQIQEVKDFEAQLRGER